MSSMGGLSLGTLWIEIGARFDEAASALQKFGEESSAFVDEQKKKWEGLASIGESFMGVGAGLTAAITVPLVGIGTAAVSTAEQLNVAKMGFTTMLGSGEKATAMLNDLQHFAQTTPFEFPDLVKASQKMMALGFSAEQVIPTLTTVGDTAAAMGKGKESIDLITLALGQMQAKGKVSAQEVNQLAEQGIPAWKILADQIGVSIPEAMKLAEKGAISSATAVPAILAGMNERFGGSMENLSNTLTGMWSNFKDQITAALIPIGQAIIPALQQLLVVATPLLDMVKNLAVWFGNLPDPVKNAAVAMAAILAAVGPLVLGIGGLMTAIGTLMPGLTALAGFFGTSVAMLAPWTIAIGAVVAGLVALGTWVYQNWDPIVATLTQAWDGLKLIWQGFADWVGGWFQAIWDGVTFIFNAWVGAELAVMTAIWDGVKAAWDATWSLIGPALTAAWDGIVAAWHAVIDPLIDLAMKVWDGLTSAWQAVWTAITSGIGGAWSAIVSAFQSGMTAVGGFLQTLLDWASKIPGVGAALDGIKSAVAGLHQSTDTMNNTMAAGIGKLASLGDAWDSAAKKADTHTTATNKTKTAVDGATTSVTNLGKAHEGAAKSAKKHKDATSEAEKEIAKQKKTAEQAAAALEKIADAHSKAADTVAKNFTPSLVGASAELAKVAKATGDMEMPAAGLSKALKDLGVTAKTNYEQIAKDAQASYDLVVASGMATQFEKDSALLKLIDAQKKAAADACSFIPAQFGATLDAMKTTGDEKTPAMLSPFEKFATDATAHLNTFATDAIKGLFEGDTSFVERGKKTLGALGTSVLNDFAAPAAKAITDVFGDGPVATAIGTFASDAIKVLWEGDKSWGEKGKILLKDLGKAVMDAFVTPATEAIQGLIGGAIKDLLGSEGLGGVWDSIKGIGSAMGGLFKSGGGSDGIGAMDTTIAGASDAAKAAGGAGGGGGGGGGIGGAAASGAMGWIGIGAQIGTMVSSIIGNFQMAKQETTLNAIEESTRYSALYLGKRGDQGILGQVFLTNELLQWGPLVAIAGNLRDMFWEWTSALKFGLLVQAAEQARNALWDIQTSNNAAVGQLVDANMKFDYMLAALNAGARQINITVTGSDPATVAAKLAGDLRAQGALA